MLISGGTAVGPLIAGFVVQHSPGTWRDFVWVCAALTGVNLVAIFLFYPESSFDRSALEPPAQEDQNVSAGTTEDLEPKADSCTVEDASQATTALGINQEGWVVAVSYPRVWTSFFRDNHVVSLPKAFAAPFVFLVSIPVLWTVFVYGSALASQIIVMYA
jgi:MFS family permease